MARPKKTTAAAAETAVKKPAAKKTAATAKKTETAAKKTTTAAKAAEIKVVTKIQFGGCEFDASEIAEKAQAAFKEESKDAIKSVNVYIKPEDNAAYFVVNDTFEGKIDLCTE